MAKHKTKIAEAKDGAIVIHLGLGDLNLDPDEATHIWGELGDAIKAQEKVAKERQG